MRAKLWQTSLEALCLLRLCTVWSRGELRSRDDRAPKGPGY